jgi:hypothetical protein
MHASIGNKNQITLISNVLLLPEIIFFTIRPMPTGKIVKNIGHGQKIIGKHIFLIKYVKQTICLLSIT